jgi:hypothetical protein
MLARNNLWAGSVIRMKLVIGLLLCVICVVKYILHSCVIEYVQVSLSRSSVEME